MLSTGGRAVAAVPGPCGPCGPTLLSRPRRLLMPREMGPTDIRTPSPIRSARVSRGPTCRQVAVRHEKTAGAAPTRGGNDARPHNNAYPWSRARIEFETEAYCDVGVLFRIAPSVLMSRGPLPGRRALRNPARMTATRIEKD